MLYLPTNIILEIIRINEAIFSNNRNIHCTETIFEYMEIQFNIIFQNSHLLNSGVNLAIQGSWFLHLKAHVLSFSELTKT